MLDAKSNIRAYIKPYGKGDGRAMPYRGYRTPKESPLYTGAENECYISAVTNERFIMRVNIPKTFDFKKSTHVQISYLIDGGTAGGGVSITEHLEKPPPPGEALQDTTSEFTAVVDGKWRGVGFAFEELSASENCDLSQEEEDRETLNRGKIEIKVQRGRYKDLGTMYPYTVTALPAHETSKRVAIDKGKSHSLQFVPLTGDDVVEASNEFEDYDWKPARGKAGKEIVFTFYYASRMILELKKIIPLEASVPAQVSPPIPASAASQADLAPTQQAMQHASTTANNNQPAKNAQTPAIVAETKPTPTLVKSEPANLPTIRTEQPFLAKIKEEPNSTAYANPATPTPPSPAIVATSTAPKAKPKSAVICLDGDDDKIEVVSTRETRRTNVKREPGNTIDITSDEPAAKKIKRDPGNNVDFTADEPAAKKIKLEDNVFAGSRAASVASTSTLASAGLGGQDAKAKRKARVMLELQEIALKKELMELED
ncbi:hypothetical protein LTR56_006172 [Elasticomyces elasticus]|nr:hypothetical protein LTR22_013000 [Elasticomyces elasticus]KAK3650467.1 hypothetical protein LTR56_006172 [Elasticomyces elasticus]KAK4928195.1 hypothetical protein LTR49_005133 [Elasticomyces elasticus]KAK5765949.1 hypothetical protein LTS12_003956 [Elasticomyces elasticus]